MILTDFQLPGYQRARCWVDELPEIPKLTTPTRTVRIDATKGNAVQTRQAAIEWLVPRGTSMYGLLGAELRPAEKGFTIELASTGSPLAPFEDAIASKTSEDVRGGLLDEYVQAVVEGMSEAAKQRQVLPCATVTCNLAACGMVGSSEAIFYALGKALLNLLVMSEELSEQSIGALLVID